MAVTQHRALRQLQECGCAASCATNLPWVRVLRDLCYSVCQGPSVV